MEIKTSEFTLSSPTIELCPKDFRPEYAFIGRSNVGKSSLINRDWYLVDLPGYGFAKRSKTVQQKIDNMINSYLLMRQQLANVFVLIDIRHDPQKIDREFIDWLGESSIPFSLVFTKADKLSIQKAKENVQKYMDSLRDVWEELPPYFVTSSEKKSGRDELLDYIDSINKQIKEG